MERLKKAFKLYIKSQSNSNSNFNSNFNSNLNSEITIPFEETRDESNKKIKSLRSKFYIELVSDLLNTTEGSAMDLLIKFNGDVYKTLIFG